MSDADDLWEAAVAIAQKRALGHLPGMLTSDQGKRGEIAIRLRDAAATYLAADALETHGGPLAPETVDLQLGWLRRVGTALEGVSDAFAESSNDARLLLYEATVDGVPAGMDSVRRLLHEIKLLHHGASRAIASLEHDKPPRRRGPKVSPALFQLASDVAHIFEEFSGQRFTRVATGDSLATAFAKEAMHAIAGPETKGVVNAIRQVADARGDDAG